MPHSEAIASKRGRHSGRRKSNAGRQGKTEPRYSVALAPVVANQVERYAETVETSMSKAIAALVHMGLANQENRKREFFKRLEENLADDDAKQEDRLVDEFRALILGH
jgi:glucose-6-phosphate-specific signal transduction histidine kinase